MLPGLIAARKLSCALTVISVALRRRRISSGVLTMRTMSMSSATSTSVLPASISSSFARKPEVRFSPSVPIVRPLTLRSVEDGLRGLEEVLVEMHVEVGEELGHRVGAHVLDPGRRHRQMQVDRRDHEGRLSRGIAEVEHRERPVAEIAAVVEELGDVFRVLGAAQDDEVDPLPVHHRLQARLVEKDRLARHGVHSRLELVVCVGGASASLYSARMPAALMIGAHLASSSRTNLPSSSRRAAARLEGLGFERSPSLPWSCSSAANSALRRWTIVRRRAGGREERLPGVDDGSGQVLGHRRQVRHEARAARRRDRERAQLVLLDHADGGGQRHDGGLDLSADRVDHRRTGAAIGHVDERHAGLRRAARWRDGRARRGPRCRH